MAEQIGVGEEKKSLSRCRVCLEPFVTSGELRRCPACVLEGYRTHAEWLWANRQQVAAGKGSIQDA